MRKRKPGYCALGERLKQSACQMLLVGRDGVKLKWNQTNKDNNRTKKTHLLKVWVKG